MRKITLLAVLCLPAFSSAGWGQAPPGWEVNPSSYEHFMTMTATLTLGTAGSADSAYYIAAFAGAQCRGVTQPVFTLDRWVFFLMMYGDSAGEELTLRAYDSQNTLELDVDERIVFQVSGSLGLPADPFLLHATSTGVDQWEAGFPDGIGLLEAFPNPFNPMTEIRYRVGVDNRQTTGARRVRLIIFDLLGREVEVLVDEEKTVGSHRAVWDATGHPSGVYLYRLQTGNFAETRRLILLR